MMSSLCFWFSGLLLAPLLPGIINKTKAVFAGRKGVPLLQSYYDLAKLLRKGAVYSRTTTLLFCAGPIVGLAALITASLLVPLGGVAAPLGFSGDLIVFAYLLALARFFLPSPPPWIPAPVSRAWGAVARSGSPSFPNRRCFSPLAR